MATSLTNLEILVQHEARDNNLDITTAGVALNNSNKIYRNLAGMLPWPEFRKTLTLTATMVAAQEAYSWAFGTTPEPKFINISSVEAETGTTTSRYDIVVVPSNESEWSQALKEAPGVPRFYMRQDNTGASLYLRPLPSTAQAGGDIKVTGYVEPTAFASGATETAFITSNADDALVHMIAANWLMHDGAEQYAQIQLQMAQSILQGIFGKDQVPSELMNSSVGA